MHLWGETSLFKKTLFVTAVAALTSTSAFAGTAADTPRMDAGQIETISTADSLQGSSAGVILPLMLLILVAAAVSGGE